MMSVDPRSGTSAPGVSVAVAAARLGLSTSTVRSWERRYGLVPSVLTPGGHRRYSEDDLELLDEVNAAITAGTAPAAAVAEALVRAGRDVAPDSAPARRGAGPGGRVLAVPGAGDGARGLARAAGQLDLDRAESVVLQSFRERGVISTWNEIVRPALVAAGDHWARSGAGIEIEHVLSEAVLGALRRVRSELPAPEDSPPVLIASAPSDQHSLMLHALAGALSERRQMARVIGAQVPVATLALVARRIRPPAIFVSSVMAGAVEADELVAALPRTRPRILVVVGGAGWPEELPDGVRYAATLEDAVRLLTRAGR